VQDTLRLKARWGRLELKLTQSISNINDASTLLRNGQHWFMALSDEIPISKDHVSHPGLLWPLPATFAYPSIRGRQYHEL